MLLQSEKYAEEIRKDIAAMRKQGYDDLDIIINLHNLIEAVQLTIGDLEGW